MEEGAKSEKQRMGSEGSKIEKGSKPILFGSIVPQTGLMGNKSTENTGLHHPDIFYFGNAPGEAGDNPINTIVNATDEIVARNFQHSAADLDWLYEFEQMNSTNTRQKRSSVEEAVDLLLSTESI